MSNRKAIRDWFKKALAPHMKELGKVYASRVVYFNSDTEQPDKFTNVYVSDGVINASDEGLGALTHMSLELGFHLRSGNDDDLDHCEFIADRALEEYKHVSPPPFMFYKESFTYSGNSDDAYEQLYVTFKIITR